MPHLLRSERFSNEKTSILFFTSRFAAVLARGTPAERGSFSDRVIWADLNCFFHGGSTDHIARSWRCVVCPFEPTPMHCRLVPGQFSPLQGTPLLFLTAITPRLLSPDRQKSSPRRRLTAEESASTIPRQSRYGGAASAKRSPDRVFNTLRFDHTGTFVASASLSDAPNSL